MTTRPEAQSADLDLATRLSNWGTADWTRLMNRADLMRISEDCVKALDEIQRLELLQRWQPIETAPRDGKRILLWFPDLGYPVTGWPEAYGYKSGGWKPSLWMPLVEPIHD